MRALQAMAVSRPPPRAIDSTAATVGFGPLSSKEQKLSLILRAPELLPHTCLPVTERLPLDARPLTSQRQVSRSPPARGVCRWRVRGWRGAHLLSMPPPPDDLANSAMSKPALNLLFEPTTTMALTSLLACASRRQLNSALRTA